MYENQNYSQHNYQMYRSKQEILDIRETQKLFRKIRNAFGGYYDVGIKFSLEQLRQIAEIIEPTKQTEIDSI